MTNHRLRATDGSCETCGRPDDALCPAEGYVVHQLLPRHCGHHLFLGHPVETTWQSIVRRHAVERGFEVKW